MSKNPDSNIEATVRRRHVEARNALLRCTLTLEEVEKTTEPGDSARIIALENMERAVSMLIFRETTMRHLRLAKEQS